jgi:hypothetical protein
MTKDNVVYFKFKSEQQVSGEFFEIMACSNCKNKTFTHKYINNDDYATAFCAACNQEIGKIGFVDDN